MTTFIIAAALIALFALALIARPFIFSRKQHDEVSMARLNARILRDEIATLERERDRGALTAAEFDAAREDIHRRLLEEGDTAAPVQRASRPWLTLGPVALMLPLLAVVLYLQLGTPAAVTGNPHAAAAPNGMPDINKMVESLAAKLEANPDNPTGWAMLGRSYKVMNRFADAAAAFERIGPALEQNADWLAEYADVLAMNAGGKLEGKPEALVKQALQVDPNNLLALMLAGSGAAGRHDYAAAVGYFERALPQVAPESEDARFLKDAIAQVKGQMGGAAPTAPAAAEPTAKAPEQAPAASQRSLALAIGIAPAMKAEASGKTLFVIARAPGERMPLAVVRRSADTLPATITLDDSASLNTQRPLSSVAKLEIEARISASGVAQAASGDLYGTANVADASVSALALQIDQRRP